VTPAFTLLIAVLAAFGALDVVVLANLRSIRAVPKTTRADLERVRGRLERLSRLLLLGGGTLGAASATTVAAMFLWPG